MCHCRPEVKTPCCGRDECHRIAGKTFVTCPWCVTRDPETNVLQRTGSRAVVHHPTTLYDALKAEGYNLPDECGDVSLVLPVDGVIQLHYVVNVNPEDLGKIGRALARVGAQTAADLGLDSWVIDTSVETLPDEWHCPHCNYGEYKNRDDWQQRLTDHMDGCELARKGR